jgi:hypothetical protein
MVMALSADGGLIEGRAAAADAVTSTERVV